MASKLTILEDKLLRFIKEDRLNLDNIKNLTFLDLITNGSPLFDENKQIQPDHINMLSYIFDYMYKYLKDMDGKDIFAIFNDIEQKYPHLTKPALISDEIINNIITRTVTINDGENNLKFVFDIELPIGINREIATIYTLNINNEKKLTKGFKYTQLYKSSGTV